MSLGEVITRAFTDVDTTPHDGHAAAVSSAVTTCTTRVPSAQRSTRSTRTPGSPNNNVVPSDTALGSFLPPECFATLQTSEGQGPPHCNDTPYESEITTARLKLKSLFDPGAGNSGLLVPGAGNSGLLLGGFGNSGALNIGSPVSGFLDFGIANSGILNAGTLLSGFKNVGIYNSGLLDIGYVPRALYVANLIFKALTGL